MDIYSTMEWRKQEHKNIILLCFITCEAFKCKDLRTIFFEGGYYVMTQGGTYVWLNVYDITTRWAYMGLKVHVMCKYICNRVNLVIKGPHVQVWIAIYKRSCIHYCGGEYEMYLVIWRGFPYSLRIYCVTYVCWSCAPRWNFVHGVYLCYFMIFLYLVPNIINVYDMTPRGHNTFIGNTCITALYWWKWSIQPMPWCFNVPFNGHFPQHTHLCSNAFDEEYSQHDLEI